MKNILCLSFGLILFSVTQPASAFFGGSCGVGCSGSCVRDGWEQVCPLSTNAQPHPDRRHLVAETTDGAGNR